jgi:hypothetical protein
MERLRGIVKEAILNIDPVLFVCAMLLSLISIVTVWGAADNFGMSKLRMQIFISVVGVFATIAVAYFDICESCGAHLDPGEKCDCEKQIEKYKNKLLSLTKADDRGQLCFI